MRINNLGYLLKQGIKSVFLHGLSSFSAICVTVCCLLIVGSFAALTYNVGLMVDNLNRTNQIIAYIDENLSESEARSLTTQMNLIDNVHSTQFKTRQEALEDFVASNGNDEIFSDLDADTFRHRIIIILEDNDLMRQTVRELEKVKGVAEIKAFYELAEFFAMLENILQVVSAVLMLVLLVVSLLIISNTVNVAMHERENEIKIMKMVGATNAFIRLPFVVEGFLLGIIGAGLAFWLEWKAYDFVADRLASMDSWGILSFVPYEELLVGMAALFSVCGIVVGVVGGFTSIHKYMNKK